MNLVQTLGMIRNLDVDVEQITVPMTEIAPQEKHSIDLSGKNLLLSEDASAHLRSLYHYPSVLDKRLSIETKQLLWRDLLQYEAIRQKNQQGKAPKVKVAIRDGSVIGFSDPELVQLKNSQIVDALETTLEKNQLPFDDAQVQIDGRITAEGWHLKLIFPFCHKEVRQGDILHGGLSVRFSASCLFPTHVENWLYRLWCENGSAVPICQDGQSVRIRRIKNKNFGEQHVLGRFRQAVGQGIRELDTKLEAVKAFNDKKANARQLITEVATKNRVSGKVQKELLEALDKDQDGILPHGGGTHYDVWNAITRVATHGSADLLRRNVRDRLSLYSGAFSQEDVHVCPQCQRILEPSRN